MTLAPAQPAEVEPFGVHNLPYGSGVLDGAEHRAVLVRTGDRVLDLTSASRRLLPEQAPLFASGTLDPLLAAGPAVWRQVRRTLQSWLSDVEPGISAFLHPVAAADLQLPFAVADYVDFYSSEHHATNVGRIFRPGAEPLTPNWKHLPIGYHGRAGTVVVSGTPVVRPHGQRRDADGTVTFGPCKRLDVEAEVGFVVGAPSPQGTPVPRAALADHVFGVCLVNDWSARDIQAWEAVPLGPFLGKSFATSISPWVVPLDALEAAWVPPPPRAPRPLPYLDDTGDAPGGLDLTLELRLNGHLVTTPPFRAMYWTPAQQLAHLTANGACLRTGDLFASGTVSGAGLSEVGSLIELTWDGRDELRLPDGSTRTYLQDGDEVVISAHAPAGGGRTLGFGEVRGVVAAARS